MTDTAIPVIDKPLLYRFLASDVALHDLGLLTGNRQQDRATAAILGQLADMALRQDTRWLSYSRRSNWYSGRTAGYLRDTPLSYRTVTKAVDMLDAAGLIEHEKARPSSPAKVERRWQSRFRAKPEAMRRARALQIEAIVADLLLRDAEGFPVPLPDTERVGRMRQQIRHINDMLTGVHMGGPDLTPCGNYMNTGTGVLVPVSFRLTRIFNGDLNHGGRAYAPYQNLPRDVRERCTLNGAPVVRVDHDCLHPQLLYAQAGVDFDPTRDDAYDVPGWQRPLAKRAFNIMVNARTPDAARSRICFELGKLHGDTHCAAAMGAGARRYWAWHSLKEAHGREADALIEAIRLRHPRIVDAFGSGAGLRLQNVDAGMTLSVTNTLLKRAIPTLPIHDENMAPANYQSRLQEVMTDALAKVKNAFISKAGLCTPKTAVSCGVSGALLSHYGTSPRPALVAGPGPSIQHGTATTHSPARLSVVASGSSDDFAANNGAGAQIGHFYSINSFNLFPVAGADEALGDYRAGILPPPARAAVRHAMRAQGLTQARLAKRMGVSRPQLVNALRGRFGLSEGPARALVQWASAA